MLLFACVTKAAWRDAESAGAAAALVAAVFKNFEEEAAQQGAQQQEHGAGGPAASAVASATALFAGQVAKVPAVVVKLDAGSDIDDFEARYWPDVPPFPPCGRQR